MNIKQIDIFKLKVLRMAGFLEYVQQVLKIVKTYRDSGEAGVSQLPAKVEAAYTPFASGVTAMDDAYKLSRASEYTQQIADEDTRRDGLYLALKNQVQMYQRFDFDAEKKAAATYLWNIMKKYGVDVNENYSEESGKLQQMIQELEADNTAGHHITTLGISSLVAQLKTANEAVRTLMSQRNDERMLQEKAALSNARDVADERYRDLVLMINAATAMEDDQESIAGLGEVISQVNELIKYYRLYVVKSGTGGNNGGGSSNGNGGSQGGGTGENGGSNTGGSGSNTGGSGDNGGGSGDDEPDQ
ncbi:MAG: hypothetical protein IK075_11135 [Prevotella sp.]|nr:hypothetical protein [Prevotella sp.]